MSACQVADRLDHRSAPAWLSTDSTTSRGSSGVSSRNIRAYRERGLLDPPRQAGSVRVSTTTTTSSQLKTINQLLRKGFNSAHIAEFFAAHARGPRPRGDPRAAASDPRPARGGSRSVRVALDLDPGCDEAQRLVSCGLAELIDGQRSRSSHPEIAEIVTRSSDQLHYVQTILRMAESTSGHHRRAGRHAGRRARGVASQPGTAPTTSRSPTRRARWRRLIQDYRDLGIARRHRSARQGAATAHGVGRVRLHRGTGGRAGTGSRRR